VRDWLSKGINMGGSTIYLRKTISAPESTLLDRIGKGLHDMLVSKTPAGGGQVKGKKDGASSKRPPTGKTNAKKLVASGADARKKAETCWAPLTMKSADGTSRYCIAKNTKGAGYVARDPNGVNTTLPIKQLRDSHAALKPTSDRQIHADKVRKEGAAKLLKMWEKSQAGTPSASKTEFKQGGEDSLKGMSLDARRNVNSALSVGNQMANAKILGVPVPGVAQLGEGVKLGANVIKGVNGAINGAPKFFSDTGKLLNGSVKTNPGEVIGGAVSGLGKFAYGSGSAMVDMATRIVAPGSGHDKVAAVLGQAQQGLDTKYRNRLKESGVNPNATGYNVTSTVTQSVAAVATAFWPSGKSVTGKPGSAGKVPGKAPINPGGNVPKTPPHPVEGLGNAVKLYDAGKISASALKDAMAHATNAFAAAKEAGAPWQAQIKRQYTQHMADGQNRTGGYRSSPTPTPQSPRSTPTVPSATPTPTVSSSSKAPATGRSTATTPLSRELYVVKTLGGGMRIEHVLGQPASMSAVARAVADGILKPSQLREARFSESTINGITRAAKALK
jgi:hypothetical protein